MKNKSATGRILLDAEREASIAAHIEWLASDEAIYEIDSTGSPIQAWIDHHKSRNCGRRKM